MNLIDLNQDAARRWIERWLAAGGDVSMAVLAAVPFGCGRSRTWASGDVDPDRLKDFDEGNVAGKKEVDAWLAQTLEELVDKGASCLVVEEDLARRTDPGVLDEEILWGFINDRLVAWFDLAPGRGIDAVREVMGVGSGYPRNAFVTMRSAADLGLSDRQQAPESFPIQVAESLLATIVSIYDNESYLVWDSLPSSSTTTKAANSPG